MASLYIKDPETARRVTEAARRLGITKTEAVRRALHEIDPGVGSVQSDGTTSEWLRAYRMAHPLPDRERMKLDKGFFDSLSDEDDIFDPAV